MQPSILKELIRDIKIGDKTVSDLTWYEFQEMVAYLVIEQNMKLLNEYSISTDFAVGEIDIILKVQNDNNLQLGNKSLQSLPEYHFIECKHHNTKLAMTTAGKVFCAGILYKPKNLIIVSSFPLYPQALEYATKFFRTDSGHGLFDNVYFYRTSIEQLLGINETVPISVQNNKTILSEDYELLSWSLLELSTFSEREIANNVEVPMEILVDSNLEYNLQVWLYGVKDSNQSSPKIELYSLKNGNISASIRFERLDFNSGETKLKFYFKQTLLSENPEGLFIRISSTEKINLLGPIKLHRIQVLKPNLLYNDFRSEETDKYVNKLNNLNEIKISLIHGEGGIGKSFFCEKIAKALNKIKGFNCHHLTINNESSRTIFFRLVWPLISINKGELFKNKTDEIGLDLLKSYLDTILKDRKNENVDNFIEQFTSLDIQNIDPEVFLFTCAKILTKSSQNNLFLIKDCHKISPQLTNDFRLFFKLLDDFGWGNVKFILEFRDTVEEINSSWDGLIREMRLDFKAKFDDYQIKNLTLSDLNIGLKNSFIGSDSAYICKALLRKTGGNPLFIKQLIEYFVDSNYIEKIVIEDSTFKLNIVDLAGIEQEIHTLSKNMSNFLKERVHKYLSIITNEDEKRKLITYLGLSSIINFQINEKLVNKVLAISDIELQILRFRLINDGFLAASYSNPPAEFIHEIMQIAILERLKVTPEFQKAAITLESGLSKNNIDEIILAGKINYELHNLLDAYEWFNIGYNKTHKEDNYLIERVCLLYLRRLLQADKNGIHSSLEKYLTICLSLGWNEFQTNSIVNAIQRYTEVIDILHENKTSNELSIQSKYLFEIQAIHNLLTSYIDLLWPIESAKTIIEEIDVVRNIERLLHLLNRFILLCVHANFPSASVKLAQLALKFQTAEEKYPPQLWSVLYSDIGYIYFVSKPELSIKFWKKGLAYAEDMRQINHSKLNILIGNVHLNILDDSVFNEIDLTEETIFQQGIEHQIIRLYAYNSIKCINRNDMDNASSFLQKALNHSMLSNFKVYEWQSNNNLGVYYLKLNDFELASKYFEKAMAVCSEMIKFYKIGSKIISEIIEKIEHKIDILSLETSNDIIIDFNYSVPPVTSEIVYLIHNIYRFNEISIDFQFRPLILSLDISQFDIPEEYLALSSFKESHALICQCFDKIFYLTIS